MKLNRISCIALGFMATLLGASGANVQWDLVGCRVDSVWGGGPWYCFEGTGQLPMVLVVEGGLDGIVASQFLGGSGNLWARVMQPGDVVDASSMLGNDKDYFYHSIEGAGHVRGDYAISRDQESVYLAILTEGWTEDYERYYVYGWLEMGVSGEPSLLASAFDLYGGGMIVGGGAIPEPSSATLLLVGLAGLGLKRKRAGA